MRMMRAAVKAARVGRAAVEPAGMVLRTRVGHGRSVVVVMMGMVLSSISPRMVVVILLILSGVF
jgi:hypothetical protein